MSKGIAQVDYQASNGEVYRAGEEAGGWDYIYTVSSTQDERFNIGDRAVLPDGREFRYAKSSSAIIASEACYFDATGYTSITAFAVAGAIGDRSVTVPAATHAALTADELRGGYILIFTGGSDNQDNQFRGIIGNDAAAANALFKVYLDGPLTSTVVVTTSSCETYQNPWKSVSHSTGNLTLGRAGVPAAYVSASGKYVWVQTKGPIFCNPQSGMADHDLAAYWRSDGSVEGANEAIGVTVATYATSQLAGYRMMGSYSGNGPIINLIG